MAPCGPQCSTDPTAGWALLQVSNRSKIERERKWERKNMCLDLQCLTSGAIAKSFLPFILAHLSRCRWARFTWPLAMSHRADSGTHLMRREKTVFPWVLHFFPPHIHGPGQREGVFSMRLQPQLKIATVVYENKSNGIRITLVTCTCCSTLEGVQLLTKVCLARIFIMWFLIKAWIFWAGWSFKLLSTKIVPERVYIYRCMLFGTL